MERTLPVLPILILLALSVTAFAGESAPDKLELRLHFEAGETCKCTTTIDQTFVQWLNEVEQESISRLLKNPLDTSYISGCCSTRNEHGTDEGNDDARRR